ncbi:DNA polymerase III subunit delta [bacterium]|nr:MAG: DNA polymerase III subunit delta [bacterium]
MIFFLYGKDSFRSYQKLKEIQDKYQKTYPQTLSFYQIDKDKDILEIKSLLESSPLFQQNKLIVLKNIFLKKADEQKKLIELLKAKKIDKAKNTFLVFWERNDVDKRGSLFKYLEKAAKIQKFSELNKSQRKNWVKKIAADKFPDLKIQSYLMDYFIANLDCDLWRIYHEIEKLATYQAQTKKPLTKDDLENIIVFPTEADIFKTIDAIASKNKKQALKALAIHFKNLEPELKILAMLEYQFRSLIKVKSLTEEKKDYYKIQRETKIHPYSFRKIYSSVGNFSMDDLKNIYEELFELDIGFKTGKIKDKKIALEMFVVKICLPH